MSRACRIVLPVGRVGPFRRFGRGPVRRLALVSRRVSRLGWALVSAFMAAGACLAAPPVWRCGDTYADRPCPGARAVDAADPRSADQRAAAVRVAADERRRGAALEDERLARDRHPRSAVPGRLDRATPAAPAAPSPRMSPKRRPHTGGALDGENFLTVEPGAAKKRS